MKGGWVDAGQEANYTLLQQHGIEDIYYDIRTANVAEMIVAASKSFDGCVYACSQGEGWGPFATGRIFADWVNERLNVITAKLISFGHAELTPGARLKVCLNMEAHDPAFILSGLQRWRQHRPSRITSWAMEGHQGGWMRAATGFVAGVMGTKVDLVAEAYRGNMIRTESDRVLADLVACGFPVERCWSFYDAKQLGAWWEGLVYRVNNLPALP